jgi:hypothetical protein
MEAMMQKILTAVAASVALVAAISAGQACDFHNTHTTAQAGQPDAVVAMSTAPTPATAEDATVKVAVSECSADAKDCPQPDK